MIQCERCQEQMLIAQARWDIKLILKFKGKGGTTTLRTYDILCYRCYRQLGQDINSLLEKFNKPILTAEQALDLSRLPRNEQEDYVNKEAYGNDQIGANRDSNGENRCP